MVGRATSALSLLALVVPALGGSVVSATKPTLALQYMASIVWHKNMVVTLAPRQMVYGPTPIPLTSLFLESKWLCERS